MPSAQISHKQDEHNIWDHSKSTFVEGRWGEGVIEKPQKRTVGGGS